MNIKKIVSAVSALAISVSAFAGMAVVANAATNTLYTAGTAETPWTADLMAEWGNSDLILDKTNDRIKFEPTKPSKAYNATKTFTVSENSIVTYDIDWYTGNSTGRTSNYEYLQLGSSLRIGYNSSYNFYVSTDAGSTYDSTAIFYRKSLATANVTVTVDTSTNTITDFKFAGNDVTAYENVVLPVGTTYDSVTIGLQRGGSTSNWGYPNGIDEITVTEETQEVTTAKYTVKYVDAAGADVKAAEERTGVVGISVPLSDEDIADFILDDASKKYVYVSDDSDTTTIAADGSAVCTVTYREADIFDYTVTTNVGTTLMEGSDFEGETITVAYPCYINNNGVLYSKDSTDSQYKTTFVLTEDNQNVVYDYEETETTGVVYYSEGEDIAGLTVSTYGNIPIRSSNCEAAYATEDVVITTLQPGTYNVYGVVFAGSSAGANLSFKLGNTAFAYTNVGSSNWVSCESGEITISEASDLTFIASGGRSASLDLIYVVKTADYTPTLPSAVTASKADAQEFTDAEGVGASLWQATIAGTGATYSKINATATLTDTTVGSKTVSVETTNVTTTGDVNVFVVINKVISDIASLVISVE